VYDKEGNSREVTTANIDWNHYVQPDLVEFRSTDGAIISGRAQWREHLARTGQVEMGHSDIRANQEKWKKKKEKFSEKLNVPVPQVETRPVDVLNSRDYEMSRIHKEVANHLEGRPQPDRKTLIKMTLETAKDLARRR